MHKWHRCLIMGIQLPRVVYWMPVFGHPHDFTPVTNFPYETCLQGIMVVVFLKTNIQSKMMNTTTVIPYKYIS